MNRSTMQEGKLFVDGEVVEFEVSERTFGSAAGDDGLVRLDIVGVDHGRFRAIECEYYLYVDEGLIGLPVDAPDEI